MSPTPAEVEAERAARAEVDATFVGRTACVIYEKAMLASGISPKTLAGKWDALPMKLRDQWIRHATIAFEAVATAGGADAVGDLVLGVGAPDFEAIDRFLALFGSEGSVTS